MKRIVYWLLSTVTVVVLLFGYRTSLAGHWPGKGRPSPPRRRRRPLRAPRPLARPRARSPARWSRPSGGPVQVQVQVKVNGGKLADVSVLQSPNGNPRDQEINAYALPILVQESLDAQSANIDMVSGATVTSDGYLQSLQGALDKAGL